ncbi:MULTISPECIES: TIGR03618 family F420-dependent PPOX class oxidoreductase [unclassified Streptomyces]|uniref:TIGR03618 family F420-dependent PPOX class oxidoreductase n=1 Tax=Streptomyces TaxID=1883 RepID=UPI00136F7312|nr:MULTISPECIES: TIGR03618 family F420-dependent PPOX class oxidoreductase [unclassified Streptomyces]MYY87088.1 TIGR03618 family F420-dependent PPOX class oxidoreductase [Streptomyces sp. SID335]MYZ18118.1 TIGR03618 family F420-dependent PPOX class oxidoreductase [Streptomyces sp. SID337]NDZ89491.1 TIGR03618 family F420-dependent PPOX class oxidoreductase [Streptomyces sp. SID10115]NEA05109.1 TIGR03618 family F420-dependent PPOX class oxidoreductase [Streptomyces sp. SID10116]
MTGTHESTWTPPAVRAPQRIPDEVVRWLEEGACVALTTLERDGRPQTSMMWARPEEDVLLMATVVGRRKHRNLLRDPRATVLVTPLGSHDHYVEIRGTVEMLPEGGRDLIDDLHEHYRGTRPYPWDGADDVRVALALRPERVLVFHG